MPCLLRGALCAGVMAAMLLSASGAQAESVIQATPSAGLSVSSSAGVQASPRQVFDGTRWAISYNAGEGDRLYDVQLHAGGRMTNSDPNDRTYGNDRWEAKGKQLILRFNDGYAVYTGTLQSDGHLKGQARNKVGDSWSWLGQASRGDTAAR